MTIFRIRYIHTIHVKGLGLHAIDVVDLLIKASFSVVCRTFGTMALTLPSYIFFFVTSEDCTLVMRTTVLICKRRTTSVYCDDNNRGRTCSTASLLSGSRGLIVFQSPHWSAGLISVCCECGLSMTVRPNWLSSLSAIFSVECVPDSDAEKHWRSGGGVSAPVAYYHRPPTPSIDQVLVLLDDAGDRRQNHHFPSFGLPCRPRARWISMFAGFERLFRNVVTVLDIYFISGERHSGDEKRKVVQLVQFHIE